MNVRNNVKTFTLRLNEEELNALEIMSKGKKNKSLWIRQLILEAWDGSKRKDNSE